jgi:RecB family endonuclease NucS
MEVDIVTLRWEVPMDWSAFCGALTGVAGGSVLFIAIAVIVDRVQNNRGGRLQTSEQRRLVIPEKDVQDHIVDQFSTYFPGWEKIGVEYQVKGKKRIDILCRDAENSLVVIELKKNKAPQTVVHQTEMYMKHIQDYLAEPSQKVRGLINAQEYDASVEALLRDRPAIELWAYEIRLQIDKSRVCSGG